MLHCRGQVWFLVIDKLLVIRKTFRASCCGNRVGCGGGEVNCYQPIDTPATAPEPRAPGLGAWDTITPVESQAPALSENVQCPAESRSTSAVQWQQVQSLSLSAPSKEQGRCHICKWPIKPLTSLACGDSSFCSVRGDDNEEDQIGEMQLCPGVTQ